MTMRILLDQVTYDMRNKGNIALLQAAVKRLKSLWPDASLDVITLAPLLPRIYVPQCNSVPVLTTNQVSRRWKTINAWKWLFPRPVLRAILELRDEHRHRRSNGRSRHMLQDKGEAPVYVKEALQEEFFNGVDLFVISGAHFICDSVKHLALAILDRLEFAMKLGIPTVMVGQGIGPITDPDLVARCREILPRVDFILVREKISAPSLLCSLGVPQEKFFVTGDDATEMTYEARTLKGGNTIGIGLRVSNYTGVNDKHVDEIQKALHEAALKYDAKFASIPISYSDYEWELDDTVLQRLSAGRSVTRHGLHRYEEPLALIKLAGSCRLVVTGAFHPAVFALAQGIPAICLSSSETYTNKFLGLVDLFGEGCKVLYMDDEYFQNNLASAIDSAWSLADRYRPELLEAARRQIKWTHEGYQQIHTIVTGKKKTLNPN